MISRSGSAVFLLVFFLLLVGPFLATDFKQLLNDTSAAAPLGDKFSVRRLIKFKHKFEDCFNENFGFRKPMVKLHHLLKLKIFGDPPSKKLIVGKEGWLFEGGETGYPFIASAQPLSPELLEGWKRVLDFNHTYLEKMKVRYLFAFAPYKQTIYPEYLPDSLKSKRNINFQDDLLSFLAKQGSPAHGLDLRPGIFNGKKSGRLYHKTDSHWNGHGALHAAVEIIDRLRGWFPVLRPLHIDEFSKQTELTEGMDLLQMYGLQSFFKEEIVTFVHKSELPFKVLEKEVIADPRVDKFSRLVTECERCPSLRLLVIHDSFGPYLVPFLSSRFARVVYLWRRGIDFEVLQQEQPQLVLHEMVEATLLSKSAIDDEESVFSKLRKN